MEKVKISNFLLGTFWTGWRRWAAWSICVSAFFLLGALRTATDADFTFASLATLPVLVQAGLFRDWRCRGRTLEALCASLGHNFSGFGRLQTA
jgi:hypothetical protein